MTPSALPQICWRPLAEVKTYVEKFQDGIDLTTLESRINSYSKLSRKDKQKLITHLEQRESILVIKANKTGKVGRPKTFLRHKKYGYPKVIPGYDLLGKKTQPKPENLKIITQSSKDNEMSTIKSLPKSPEELRKEAERLIKEAEEVERKRNESDVFNKKLSPIKLEICQAAGKMQRKLDEFIDCMDEMNKAIQKLKELSAQ